MDNAAADIADQDSSSRRRSGRVVKVPEKYGPDASALSASAKRKRRETGENDADDDDLESDQESGEDDADSDEDHPAPRSRKPAGSARQKKPSLKKPKINGSSHVARIPSRPKKAVRIDAGRKGTGLFGKYWPWPSFVLYISRYAQV